MVEQKAAASAVSAGLAEAPAKVINIYFDNTTIITWVFQNFKDNAKNIIFLIGLMI